MSHRIPLAERPYRQGVGVVLLNDEGLAFAAQRIDTIEPAWQFPQGGIDDGETPDAAVLRELEEEIGVGPDKVAIIAETPGWLSYDLPPDLADRAWKGRFRGQSQKWFAARFLGIDSDIDINTRHPEFRVWRWMPLLELPPLIVPFKRRLYEAVVNEFLPLARDINRA